MKLAIQVLKPTIGNSTATINVDGTRGQVLISIQKQPADAIDECRWWGQLTSDHATIKVSGLTSGSTYNFELYNADTNNTGNDSATTTGASPKQTKSEILAHDKKVLLGLIAMQAYLNAVTLPKTTTELIQAALLKAGEARASAQIQAIKIAKATSGDVKDFAGALKMGTGNMVTEQKRKIAEDEKGCHFDSIVQR